MPSKLAEHPQPQPLVLHEVSWAYYEHLLDVIGDGHVRVNYLDGEMEIISSNAHHLPNYLLLENVPWTFYEETLEQIGDRPLRVTYSDGRMEIMSPLPPHEKIKKAIGRLIEAMTEELDIPTFPFGATTFRREDRSKGLEPDECYYFTNISQAREMKRFDADKVSPPDLAIEVDIFSRSVAREVIYANLGVGELWRYREGRIFILQLVGPKYEPVTHSRHLPPFDISAFEAFVERMQSEDQNAVLREFRRWVRSLR